MHIKDIILHIPRRLLRLVVDAAVRALTNPSRSYSPSEVSNVGNLKRRVKLGDVILVSGNARISTVVKVLTMSQWSHVVLYVGDRRDLLSEKELEEWTRRYGEKSLRHLVIDADPIRRVHLKPLDDYVGLMVRHCRAEALTSDDTKTVIDVALSQLGREYDVRHIISLLFFFAFPWELLPHSWRRVITDFTLSEDDRICSRVLSEAFHSVGYPIRPLRVVPHRGKVENKALGFAVGMKRRSRSAMKLLMGGRIKPALNRMTDTKYAEIHLRGPRHLTPSDYDLSRFFSVVKDESDLKIAYKEARILCPLPE